MREITKEVDPANLVTRIYPLGYGEGDNQLTIASVNGGAEYLEADTVGIYGLKETIWVDRRFSVAENLMATAAAMLERLKTPHISYTVGSVDLFKRTGDSFDELRAGKMVRVIDEQDGINVNTRIVEVSKSDVATADITVVLENKDRNVAGSIAALQERTRINETYAQGAETLLMLPLSDNADPDFPAVFEFFIPEDMVNINRAILRVQLQPFRTFSRSPQTTPPLAPASGETQTGFWHMQEGDPAIFGLVLPGGYPPHSHMLRLNHTHVFDLLPHTHAVNFGIFEGERAQNITLRVDGNLIAVAPEDFASINIINHLSTGGGGRIRRGVWHRLEIVPDRLTRISAQLFLTFFTNSRGGGNNL